MVIDAHKLTEPSQLNDLPTNTSLATNVIEPLTTNVTCIIQTPINQLSQPTTPVMFTPEVHQTAGDKIQPQPLEQNPVV